MKRQTLVSGIRASSNPHIGNYLGAIKQFIQLQDNDQLERFYFIADLHSLTTPFEKKELRKNTFDVAATYLALGLDPKKSTLFLQSQIAEHSELAWIFECITPLGELYRMTQYKEKSAQHKDSINSGLLNYPVLMAADVLLYKADLVPVGEDQVQHVELARIIARKFNNQFGKTFPEPKAVLTKAARVKSLTNPEKKMSKTGDTPIYISDSPAEIKSKLKKAVTASDASGKSAGVQNLMNLLAEFGSEDQVKYFEQAMAENTIKYSELKEVLAENISDHFAIFREQRQDLLANPQKLDETLAAGAQKASTVAKETMREVKEKVGLL